MKRILFAVVVASVLGVGATALAETPVAKDAGEAMFKTRCVMCHSDGGNIINPRKTLNKTDREANNIRTEADIVTLMRKPGPGMTTFDPKTLSDMDAGEIAKYIMKNFK
jgi:cytochrome c6